MVYYLYGENSFALERELARLIADSAEEPEKLDGSELGLHDLPDIFSGQTLFATKRLIVIRDLADNKTVWSELENYLHTLSEDVTIILIDTKTDKRSKTYKALHKIGKVTEFITPKTAREAEQFARAEATNIGIKLDQKLVRKLVERVGLEPWNIVHALEKLTLLDTVIDAAAIDRIIEMQPSEQVFGLFEASLRGQTTRVHDMCRTLALNEEPYRVMGLLATQVVQLAALVTAKSRADVANDLGLKSEYGLSKLQPIANTMNRDTLHAVVDALATADDQMKSTGSDPWSLVEQALIKIASARS